MSLRPSSAASPRACSGLMYSGVPIDMPVSVSRFAPPARSTSRAMPKSLTTAWPDANSTFSGLMSRCTMPRACA